MEEEHDELAQSLEKEAESMGRQSDELETEIEDVKQDWHAKQQDEGVPGADTPGASDFEDTEDREDFEVEGDAREPGDEPSEETETDDPDEDGDDDEDED
jgi:HPt (histidine-containing phosphotransfer) domain-containing protein